MDPRPIFPLRGRGHLAAQQVAWQEREHTLKRVDCGQASSRVLPPWRDEYSGDGMLVLCQPKGRVGSFPGARGPQRVVRS